MNASEVRALTAREWDVLKQLLAPAFPGRDEVLDQAKDSLVSEYDANGSLCFVGRPECMVAQTEHRVPTEGEYEDSDGVNVHVLIHVVEGRLVELEVYREDGGPVVRRIGSTPLKVYAPT